MPSIAEIVQQYRRRLLTGERQAALELVRYYQGIAGRIMDRLAGLTSRITAAREAGEEVSVSWLFEQERLELLLRQVEAELAGFSRLAEQTIRTQQIGAVRLAQEQVAAVLRQGLREAGIELTFAWLPSEALTDLIGTLQDGSPLRELLDRLGPAASQRVRESLVQGVALGQGPREIARSVRQDLGGNLVRALRISRTEVLRSYRTAAIRNYQANRDVIRGWVWQAAMSPRTCAMCYAMHGTFHPIDEPFYSHVQCRCVPVPQLRPLSELGIDAPDGPQLRITPGPVVFDRLPVEDQRRILGPGKFALYQAGEIELTDLVGERQSARWGPSRYEKPLYELIGRRGRDAA